MGSEYFQNGIFSRTKRGQEFNLPNPNLGSNETILPQNLSIYELT